MSHVCSEVCRYMYCSLFDCSNVRHGDLPDYHYFHHEDDCHCLYHFYLLIFIMGIFMFVIVFITGIFLIFSMFIMRVILIVIIFIMGVILIVIIFIMGIILIAIIFITGIILIVIMFIMGIILIVIMFIMVIILIVKFVNCLNIVKKLQKFKLRVFRKKICKPLYVNF